MALVLAPTKKFTMKFADAASKTARMDFYTTNAEDDPTQDPYAELMDLTQDVSNCKITEGIVSITAIEDTPGSPTAGDFASGLDKMELKFVGTDGSPVTVNFPGPLTTNFVAGSARVNQADANVDALIDAIVANCKTAEGTAIRAYTGGIRRSPPGVKRGIS